MIIYVEWRAIWMCGDYQRRIKVLWGCEVDNSEVPVF